jgi:hypothetical protein
VKRTAAGGFSIVELVIALGLTAATFAVVFAALTRSGGLFTSGGEAADIQQRLRAAADAIGRDLLNAGGGAAWGVDAGPLLSSIAPILPYRQSPGGDPPGTFRADAITLISVSAGPDQTRLQRAYYTAPDPATGASQLIRDDGDGVRTPIVNHVAELRFEWFGDPRPPVLLRPPGDPNGPLTTYGPAPLGTTTPSYRPGENCVFNVDDDGMSRPRLEDLTSLEQQLVLLGAAQLTDGPWCPDPADPQRFDADLLRIRSVGVLLRVESALPSLRGRAASVFANPGTSRGGLYFVPDFEVRFELAPRNLNLGR